MDKRLQLQLNANRKISGVLRGYDAFMNIVLDETVEEISVTERRPVGMVVHYTSQIVMFIHYFISRLSEVIAL
jgi:small nuclear ribonucleoprotein G